MPAVTSHRWTPPTTPQLAERWDAETYVFGLQERGSWFALGRLKARLREGERVPSAEAVELGLYRPSSLVGLMLHDDDLAPMPSSWGELSPVGLGDVVLSKFLPVSAAWVSQSTPRRPSDANCVRVIGLASDQGFWIANVLEHPTYQQMLARRASAATIPRVGLRDLRALRVPETPLGIGGLTAEWTRASRDLTAAREGIRALQDEVNTWVELDEPPSLSALEPRFYPAADVDDSWTPGRLALRGYQSAASRRGWVRLAELLSEDSERLRGRRVEALRVLRLSDADGGFGFDLPELAELRHPTFRIYARPFGAGEVLLSVLGSASKVVFHHPGRAATVWLSDHWARFQPREDPGALALLLRGPVVSGQLALATTGSARQFVPRTELLDIHIPWPECDRRRHWHGRLSTALEGVAQANDRLEAVRTEMRGLVDEHLGGRR